jgi:isopentenyl diphosphate isomerase/L-lactate dehydrogenase-like FMN-dependent dehydrogenase
MQRMGVPLRPDERSCFPLDLDAFCKCLAAGDEEAKVVLKLGGGWFQEMASGRFLTWEDLGFLRDNWDRSILLKGLQTVEDEHATIDVRMDGTVNSMLHACPGLGTCSIMCVRACGRGRSRDRE